MLNGVNLRIKLNRAKNVFCSVSSAAGASFKVVITEAILFVRTVKVASSIILGHAAALNTPGPSIPSAEPIVKCSLFQEDLAVLTLTTFFWVTFPSGHRGLQWELPYQPLLLQTPQLNSSGCLRGRRTNSPKTFVPKFSRRWWSKCDGLLSKVFSLELESFPRIRAIR